MQAAEEKLLDALRCAVHGETVSWGSPLPRAEQGALYRLASIHSVLPLVAEAVYNTLGDAFRKKMVGSAKQLTIFQAQRTAEFLLLYRELGRRGLQPTVMKGIVLRGLYPHPDQRPSVDEDLFVSDAEYPAIHDALLSCGLHVEGNPPPDADEVTYRDDDRHLYLEVHKRLFALDSDAYGDCNVPFVGALERTVTVQIEDVTVRTLAPTDHLLFLICHAYKHFLHSGVGIRQICDMGLFARRYSSDLDWDHIESSCRSLHIDRFAAALFRIGQQHLGFDMPAVFADYVDDTAPLLEDILSGGVYGAEDINRLHSSTMTLHAVAADRKKRRRAGALRSVFLPLKEMQGHYPYLRKRPWLLPAAWTQRIWGYVTRKSGHQAVKPTETLRIAKDRIALLRRYGIIE